MVEMCLHPLEPITPDELRQAIDIIKSSIPNGRLRFNFVDIYEAPKAEVIQYLEKRNGNSSPDRRARIYFRKMPDTTLHKAIINLSSAKVVSTEALPDVQGPADVDEILAIEKACDTHPDVLAEIAKLKLPLGTRVVNDPWCYGTDDADERRRLYQCYMYLCLNDDPEGNHYSIPLPFSPVFDAFTLELQWIDQLPVGDGESNTTNCSWLAHKAVEYSTKLLGESIRQDLMPLQVQQPRGPSFTVEGRKILWQKWEFLLGWNLREGPVLHDVKYEGRSTFYRLALSEMTVPYGDPRTPYHRKQAFDLGDTGLGLNSNTLKLGCDCLGHIHYFDGYRTTSTGEPVLLKNVVCMHEADGGIGWKHVNWRTQSASVTRNRQLIIQCIATVANYEYVLAFILDQSANIHIEVRATGIVSTVPIHSDVKKLPPWGVKVAQGALALNHQHLFSVRIDPAIDGYQNTIVYDDIETVAGVDQDPFGVAFEPVSTIIQKPGGYELNLEKSRVYKMQNSNVLNPISGKPVAYKLHAVPSQMMIMKNHTFSHKRGIFGSKPIWVTQYQDDELYAAGEFTNQSRHDTGLALWAHRDENVVDADVVLWHTFGLTHIVRPEDFPVMPVEIMTVSLKPSHFFACNPSNDVPRSSQSFNKSSLA